MPAYGVLGGQWGDEGKGKIVDLLSSNVDMVVRFSGGNNAGHTVNNSLGEFKLRLIPSGIFWPRVIPVIGNGVVVDPEQLINELTEIESSHVDTSKLIISDHAHVVMPYHILLDQLEEQSKGNDAIGTTGRGIGPAYMDKAGRVGIRVGDLVAPDYLKLRLSSVLRQKNEVLTKIYGAEPINFDDLYEQCIDFGNRLRSNIASSQNVIFTALAEGKKVLLEGAQGALLDLDHGTYPYVTSSSPMMGGAVIGSGVPPSQVAETIGVFKAYSTRVGAGPMITELHDSVGNEIRNLAWEYGTVTGRPRRVGWFDGIAAKYSSQMNGYSSCVLTRLDVLDELPEVKICTGYLIDGKEVDFFPASYSDLEKAKPILKTMAGWSKPTAGASSYEALPAEAKDYISEIENLIGAPIDLISTGPHRDESIIRRNIIG